MPLNGPRGMAADIDSESLTIILSTSGRRWRKVLLAPTKPKDPTSSARTLRFDRADAFLVESRWTSEVAITLESGLKALEIISHSLAKVR